MTRGVGRRATAAAEGTDGLSGLTDDERRTIAIFESAAPSVLCVTNVVSRRPRLFGHNTLEVPQGQGSGFVWDDLGHIVTNFHVVDGASEIVVTTADQAELSCTIVGTDPSRDIAVLRVRANRGKTEGETLRPLPAGHSASLKVGQRVFTIGNPFGLDHTFTSGVVSALGRELPAITGRRIPNMIQTDAAINPGSSGGPLLDSCGRVIGMNTMIFSPSGASAGVGFAIPVDSIKVAVSQLIKYGRPVQPGIGLALAPDTVLRRMGIEGALVASVTSDEIAGIFKDTQYVGDGYRRRLELGDILIKINSTDITQCDDVFKALDGINVGDVLEVTFLRPNGRRNGRSIEVEEHTARIRALDVGRAEHKSKL
mmetsp:Transcript_12285/g.36878  ORF Transcript_12285/g.36878 Transcript_12285/m.36878 type:complete len:369 (+) Transcript_12285:530-1636(+)